MAIIHAPFKTHHENLKLLRHDMISFFQQCGSLTGSRGHCSHFS